MIDARCRWDGEAGDYLLDGEPCRTDDYGDRTRHCTARRTCSHHVGYDELTCARCLGRVRADMRQIVDRAALMLPEALVAGVDSEAAMLAGPACDPEAWSWRKVTAMQGRAWHLSVVEEDDDWHPFTILTRWAWRISNEYNIPEPDVWNITNAAQFLDRILGRVAQDEGQDFQLLRREVSKCRSHLEAVLRDSLEPERGVPCPICAEGKHFVRLEREYAHWCEAADCERIHVADESEDRWRCPRKPEHEWTPGAYRNYLEDRRGA